MISDAQAEANRRNAQNSTGPRTEAGKRSSSGKRHHPRRIRQRRGRHLPRSPPRIPGGDRTGRHGCGGIARAERRDRTATGAPSREPLRQASEARRLRGSLDRVRQRSSSSEAFDQVILAALLEADDADALYNALTADLSPDEEDWFHLADFVLRFAARRFAAGTASGCCSSNPGTACMRACRETRCCRRCR